MHDLGCRWRVEPPGMGKTKRFVGYGVLCCARFKFVYFCVTLNRAVSHFILPRKIYIVEMGVNFVAIKLCAGVCETEK